MIVRPGSTDVSALVFLQDSTTGLAEAGVAHTSLTVRYTRNNAAPVSITMSALAAMTTAHTDGGWKEADATNAQGIYRIDLPDAAIASGARTVVVTIQASGVHCAPLVIDLGAVGDVTADVATSGPAVAHNSPVGDDQELTLYVEDDYSTSRILTFTVTDYSGFNVNGASGVLRLLRRSRYERAETEADVEIAAAFTQSGTTVTATVTIASGDLSALETSPAKDARNYRYQVIANPSVSGAEKVQTVIDGWCTVAKSIVEAA